MVADCPKKTTIVLRGHDIYNSQDEATFSDQENEHSPTSSSEDAYPCDGRLVMIRRLLNNQPSAPLNDQIENIFHIRCNILNNMCSLIIDSESCCNCGSIRLVEKLNSALILHPKPYKLHWLNEDGDIKVNHQVDIQFSIGNYKDQLLCDVIPMEACHILLG